MKGSFFKLLVVLIFTVNALFGQENKSEKKVIIIDPGHGGVDYGAIGVNRLKEKDVVLEIAKEILLLNRTLFDDTYEIYLTRYSDTLISLSHRTKLARIIKPSLFISLHCNHSDNAKASGIEVYIYNKVNPETENLKKSKHIASIMIGQLNDKLGFRNRGIKKANFHVLRETVNTCPAVLAELGFLSNLDEAKYLKEKNNYNALALAILMSIKLK